MLLEPYTAYPIPAGTRYILLTVQKTVDIIPETILLQLMEKGFKLGDFRKMKRYDQKVYKLPPPTPAHVRAEANKRPLVQQPGPSSKRNRVFITPVIIPTVLIVRPSTALATPQPVSIPEPPVLTTPQFLLPDPPPELTTPLEHIPDPPVQIPVFQPPVQIPVFQPPVQIPVFQPPVQISPVPMSPPVQIPDPTPELTTPLVRIPPVPTTPPVQFFLPDPPSVQILLLDPPPVVETLESNLMDDSTIDHIMSSIFGDCSQLPRHIPINPSCWTRCLSCLTRCRHRTTIVFGNLGQWPDRVTYYEHDYPYTIIFVPNIGVHIPRSFGKTVILFRSHLDLTWDKGVELRFFQVGRPPSHRVWEAYQPLTTDAYSLDFTDCPRVADVYVK
ncbi:uncharacterized protein TNCV_5124141 [Trichonephila clavipes]|nr:uncharacterized protein TNCV_5124141 [Trichonephila clavipes]